MALRAAAAALPDSLRAERESLDAALSSLVLSHTSTHISNFRCEADVRAAAAAADAGLPSLCTSLGSLAAGLEGGEAAARAAAGMHGRLMAALSQHNSHLQELLEAPALMDACCRGGMYDEALDVAEFATALFFTHRLWNAGAAAAAPGVGLIQLVVADVRKGAEELRDGVLAQLAGKVALPTAIRLLAVLRRLYTQQALARKRAAAAASAAAAAAAATSTPATTTRGGGGGGVGMLTAEDDYAILATLRAEFLVARDGWHRAELDAISPHNPVQYLLRVVEAQRSGWADVAHQYVAATSTLRASPDAPPAGGAASLPALAAADTLRARAQLAEWLRGRVAWFVSTLAATLPAVDDLAAVASLAAQCTYAARRSGRLGADYTHLVTPLFAAHVQSLLSRRLAAAVTCFGADLRAWSWAYKLGYEPEDAAVRTAPPDAAAPALAPPPALLRHIPLADLTNAAVALLNTLRPCLPADALPSLAAAFATLITAAAAAVEDAAAAEACPLTTLAAARARARGGSTPATQPRLSDDDAAALRRYDALASALGTEFGPYLMSLFHVVVATATHASTPAAAAAPALAAADAPLAAAVAAARDRASAAAAAALRRAA